MTNDAGAGCVNAATEEQADKLEQLASASSYGDDLSIQVLQVGRDWMFAITGGDPHIGAVSTASKDDGEWKVKTTPVPGHKEHVLTGPMALQAAQFLKTTVTVVAGIHYDNLTAADIDMVVDKVWKRFLLELNTLL
ncbi:hypothetical protein LQV63_22925 [Paenibacillus profundus]|uniref:Prenylated flavin chaperone LpdD-like domain-containing protein n=1 Tax=Paenibacillus profundus TaxID=1173085 RepID=A0ABS8YP79_9BACL|nr:hypothetical protein [Paenibacillus profundus]MCE5172140.1 hypothetical protein [Paenibacillus profundus]